MKFDINVIERATEKLNSPENSQLVLDRAVNKFLGEERDKQVELIAKGARALHELRQEFLRIKPDFETYSEKGDVLFSGYTKNNLETRNRKLQGIEKIERCLESALDKNDYKPLRQMVQETEKKKPDKIETEGEIK